MERKEKLKAFKELSQRINRRECWAWQIQSAAFMIRSDQGGDQENIDAHDTGQSATNTEAANIMRACKADIVDLYPR